MAGFLVVIALLLGGLFAGVSHHGKAKTNSVQSHKPPVESPAKNAPVEIKNAPVEIPTPALLPGLIVFFGNALRKCNKDS